MQRITVKAVTLWLPMFTVLLCACAAQKSHDTVISSTDEFAGNGQYAVEVLAFADLTDPGRKGRKVPIKVHLPKENRGPFPVIVVSHGAGGNWDTHYAQAHHLASHGYVVLCVEHTGSNTKRMKNSLRWIKNLHDMVRDPKEVFGRPRDISFAIDQAEKWNQSDPRLKGRLDLGHIGMLGHSFGAYTTLVVSGARPALDWLEPPVEPGKGLGPDLHDVRVKCSVALSPQSPGGPFFYIESFAYLRIPIMGVSGTKDRDLSGDRPPDSRYQAFSFWPANNGVNKYVWINNASHLDFADGRGSGRGEFHSSNREDVQSLVRAATLLFFNAHLKNDDVAVEKLTSQGLQSFLSGSVDGVEVRSK